MTIFQGPELYITPSWYPSKHADGKAVPTWNYAVVHAYGKPRAIEDSRLGVAAGLESQDTDRSRAMADFVLERAGTP